VNEDRELIRRAQYGDDQAFAAIVSTYQRRIVSIALRLLGNRDDALDVAQEVFIRLHRYLPQYDRRRPFFTWLYRIVVNVCHDQLRNARPWRDAVPLGEVPPGDLPRCPPPDHAGGEIGGRVRELTARLSDTQRLVFLLREMEGFSCGHIAQTMDLPEGTVRSHLHHARKKLSTLLAKHYPELIEGLHAGRSKDRTDAL